MTHGKVDRCPNCKRALTPAEIYCYFCEMDISELKKKMAKQSGHATTKSGHGH